MKNCNGYGRLHDNSVFVTKLRIAVFALYFSILTENVNVLRYFTVASHFVPRSFRTYFGHFVPTFGHFVPSNNHFVPRSFRTTFGHFVSRSTGYEMTIWWSIRTQVISYPFWSFRTHFGHFVPSKDGWIDERTDGQACFD